MLTRKNTAEWADQCENLVKQAAKIADGMAELIGVARRYGDEAPTLASSVRTASDSVHEAWADLNTMYHAMSMLAQNVSAAQRW